MTLPYSDALFVCAFPRECTEAFLEGHVRAFAFFGGVPRRISYDNSKIAVARITGGREPQGHRRVPPAQEPLTCSRTTSAWCGGPTRRGTSRRWSATPAATSSCRSPPCTAAWSRSTPDLERRCREDLARRLRGKPATKAELLDEERAALLPLPAEAFVAARVEPPVRRLAVAGPLRRQRLLGARPSTPTTAVTVVASVDAVRIVAGDRVVGRPPPVLGPRAGLLRPGPLPGPAGAQARGAGLRRAAGGLGAAGLLRRPAAAAGGRVRRAGDAAVHQGPAAAGAGRASGELTAGRRAGAGAGRRRRRRGAADPGAPAGAAGRACSASTAGRT